MERASSWLTFWSLSVQEPWDSFVMSSRQSVRSPKGKVRGEQTHQQRRKDHLSWWFNVTSPLDFCFFLSASQWQPVPGAPASTGRSVFCRPHTFKCFNSADDGQTVSGKEEGQAYWQTQVSNAHKAIETDLLPTNRTCCIKEQLLIENLNTTSAFTQ